MDRMIVIEQPFVTSEYQGMSVYVRTLDEKLTLREAVLRACVEAYVNDAASVFDCHSSIEIGGSVVYYFVVRDHA